MCVEAANDQVNRRVTDAGQVKAQIGASG